jgi:hypothetical protein
MTDKLLLKVDLDRLTLDDMIALDEGNASPRVLREFLSHFMVDDKGKFLPEEKAIKQAGQLSMSDVKTAVEQFSKEVDTEAVNPTTEPD